MIKQLTTNTSAGTRRVYTLLAITCGAWLIAWLFTHLVTGPASRANEFFYDVFYRTRAQADMTGSNGDVVLVAADQDSLTRVNERFHFGWPWPREFWGTHCNVPGQGRRKGDCVRHHLCRDQRLRRQRRR